jgi:hypothetical protein
MKARPKILLALTGVAALSLAYPASVQASVTYQYIGNHFTFVTGPYTTSDFVTVMFRLADPLPANFDGTVTPTAFTVTDGVQTINNHNATAPDVVFQFATDATSTITHWHVGVAIGDFPNIDTFNLLPDIIGDDAVDENLDGGGNSDSPGVWSVNASVPDAGSTLSLMTLTLMALALVARRSQRAAG